MNGCRPFSAESSAWQQGYEAGIRIANHGGGRTAVADQMTAEEAVLHVKKIVNSFNEEYDDMGVVEQMRHGGDLAEDALAQIKRILDEVSP